MNRCKYLRDQRKAICLNLCNSCKVKQKERKDVLFRTDEEGLMMLPIQLCRDCLESNASLSICYDKIGSMGLLSAGSGSSEGGNLFTQLY